MSSVTRLRAPHKIHVLSWALALERDGSVACHFKDCQFMALSLEEMGHHYPFCACENNKYPFICETCSRRTDAMEKLLLHKLYSHSYKPTDEESRKIDDYLKIPTKKEISSVLRRSWEIFLEKKKYLKCLMRKCLFVTDSIASMEDHYLSSCKESFWSQLKHECEFCHGRLLNDYDLKLHIRKAHESKTYLMKNNVEPECNLERVQLWSEEIMLYKQGKCFIEGCKFVDNYVKILEKHYATCDGSKKNFIVCCACGSWLLNEARLSEHKRCFHKDLDEEDFKRLSREYELESENHNSLLLDEMSADENDPYSGEAEVDIDRRTNDLKKYNGVINRTSRKSSAVRLSPPVFPAKNTDSIDCTQISDRSGIQYDSDIIEINEGSLDIIDIDSSVTKKVLNDGMKLNDKKKRRRSNPHYVIDKNCVKDNEKKNFSGFYKKIPENWPTPLQAFANEMMKENKNISTVPVQIKVDNKDWTVNVSTTVVSQPKSSSEFPKNREALFKSLKEESYRLLKLVSKKNSIRNDVRMVFDPNENRITPFHINFKKDDINNDKSPDNLDMTKFLSSDVEESDDDVSNSDMSVSDGQDLIGSPVSLPNVDYSHIKVPNEAHNFIDESNEHDAFHRSGNDVDRVDSELLCSNEKLRSSCGPETNSETNPENGFKTELNDDVIYEGPSGIVALSNAHDGQEESEFLEEEVNCNTSNEGTEILCLSDVNHLGEEVMVKNELDQKVLSKNLIDQKTGSVVSVEVLGIEDNQQSIIATAREAGESCNKFESEYIIPEIDFVDNSGFRCSNEQVNVPASFHADNSNSSYDLQSDTGVNLTEDEVSGNAHSNDTSQDVSEEYVSKPNEELVMFDNELPTSSLQPSDSGVSGEKDPLSIDGYTAGVLFYDPETDYDNRDVYSSDKNESCSNDKNVSLSDNENGICDNTKGSTEENTDDLTLSNKWNWSNLKKYNSKTTQNDMAKMRKSHCGEYVSKQSKEDDKFMGFSDCTDSSSKYCNFVSACSKLGYYDDMVILNQHYEIIPPNKKSWHFVQSERPLKANGDESSAVLVKTKKSEVKTLKTQEGALVKSEVTNNSNGVFLGFNSRDNNAEFHRKSIEISRRWSEEFSDVKNKIDQSLNNTIDNISSFFVAENEQNTGKVSSGGSYNLLKYKVSSNEVKLIDQSQEKNATVPHSRNSGLCNLSIDSKKVGGKEKKRSLSLDSAPKKRGRPRKNQNQFTITNIVNCVNVVNQKENDDTALEELNCLPNDSVSSVNHSPDQLAIEQSQPDLNVTTEDRTDSNEVPLKAPSTLTDKVQFKNSNLLNTDGSSSEVKDMGHQSIDDCSLIHNGSSFTSTLDIDLNKVESNKKVLENFVASTPRKRGRPKKNQSLLATSSSADQIGVNVNMPEAITDTDLKELKHFQNEDTSMVNDFPNCAGQESTQVPAINVDHETERHRDEVEDIGCHSIDDLSATLIPAETKETILSTPVKSSHIDKPIKEQSESKTSEVLMQCNGSLDLKEENTEDEESDHFDYNDESVINELPDWITKEQTPPISTTSNDNISDPSESPKPTCFRQCINSPQESSHFPHDEIKDLSHQFKQISSSIPCVSSFEAKVDSLIASNELVQKKRGRPRKNPLHLIASTPTKASCTLFQNGENTNPDVEESSHCDNEESMVNTSTNLTSSSFDSENKRIPIESVTNEETSSVLKQEDIEHIPERKFKIVETNVVNTIPLKRKPGRPPKRLSLCPQGSEEVQKKIINRLDSSLAAIGSGNKSLLLNSSVSPKSSCNEQKDVNDKSRDVLLIQTSFKRKPGRPPKHLSLCLKGSEQLQRKTNNIANSPSPVSETSNKNILNSLASMECESLSFGEQQKDVDGKSRNVLLIEKEDVLEMPLKRKPGRPPKRLSVERGAYVPCHKEINSIPVENSESSAKDHAISNSFSEKDKSYFHSQTKTDANLKSDSPSQIKDKEIEFSSNSTLNELKNITVGVSGNNSEMENNTSSDFVPKRKPGRPPKHSRPSFSASVNHQRFELDKKESEEIHNCDQSSSDIVKDKTFPFDSSTSGHESFTVPSLDENEKTNFKSQDSAPIKNRDILELPLKRKPGRPPKRPLLINGEINQYKIEYKDTSASGMDSNGSINDSLCSFLSNGTKENVHYIPQDKLLMDQKDCLEPPLKRKPGRPPKSLFTYQLKMQRPIENHCDKSITEIDLDDPLSIKEKFPEDANKKLGEEKNSSELMAEREPDKSPNSLDINLQGTEECQFGNENLSDKYGESSTNNSLLNSFFHQESCSNVSQLKYSHQELKVEGNNIVVKRKPGRPPKRLSIGLQDIGSISVENNLVMETDKSINSSILNSSSNVNSLTNISYSKEDANHKVGGEGEISFEPPHKRKPGRPPKRLSIGLQEIEKRNMASMNMEDIPVSDGLSNVSLNGEDVKMKIDGEKKVSFEVPLKRKPGRPPKHLYFSQQNISLYQNNSNQNVLTVNSSGYSEPPLKRGPGRPRKVSLEPKYCEENNSMPDTDQMRVKIENESSCLNSFDVSLSQERNETSLDSSQPLPKRKPGRPRKVSLFAINSKDSSDTSYRLMLERGDFSVQSSSLSLESSVHSEHTPKRRPGRPRKHNLGMIATSTPSANEAGSALSFNSFADLELLDDSDTPGEERPKRKFGRPRRRKRIVKIWRRRKEEGRYSETFYSTFNNDDTDLETSKVVPKEEEISNIDSSMTLDLNCEDDGDSNAAETDLSQESEGLNESNLTIKQKARLEKRKLLSSRVNSLTRFKNPNDKVKCASCGEIMTVIHYQKEHMLKHSFMCWLEGEEPLPLDDIDIMDTVLIRGKRANPTFIFRCEVCHQEKKSSKGFLSHIQFCGKSDKEREGMMVSCTYCGRLMMPASLQPHIYQSHRAIEQTPISEESSGPVRKAAAKCLGKIASIIEEHGLVKTEEKFHVDGDEEFDEIEEISLLYIPVQKKKTTKHLMNRWRQLAADNKPLHCIVPTCSFKSYHIKEVVHHHKICTADGSQGFSCIKCNYICKVEDEMREHVKSCNPPIMVSQSDNSEDEDHEKHVIIPYLKSAEQNLTMRYKVMFFKPALTWMKEIYAKYFTEEPLYPDLHLNLDLWEEMDPQTSQFYNPEKSNSMMVSFQNSSWESMHALDGKVIEGNQGIAYTGGPVWGLEWCPGDGPQYLAVSSHLSMEFNFQAGSTFTGPGLVQLWSLEDITNTRSDSLSTLQFCYGVCHNERACWNIAWCPSGGRTETRIGLLALATTSGSIPIYAMPNPDCLQYQSTRFYKPEPVVKLEVWSNERWQCSAISWSKIKPHNIIAAGFVNGMVAVWNLEEKSKLLRKNTIIYPFKVFQAHHSIITGVCLSPESDNYLATASYDKSFKYWDIMDTTAPHTVLKRGLFTSVDWLRHWMSAVTTYDNAYTMMQTTVSLSSVRGFVNPTTPLITGINSTAWSVSVNDWLNGAITSYDNGQVVLFLALRQSISHHSDKRKFTKVILNSTLYNIEAKDRSGEFNPKQKEKETHKNNIPSNSYGDAIQKYGLSIKTDPDIGRYDKFQERGSENVNDIYPLSSINRVAWNTNKKSFLYTAMGYQSGFLVVSKLSFNAKDLTLIEELTKL